MNRTKIIYSNFDKDTGISIVKIQTPLGVFTGKSTLREEDKPYISSIAGCRYAEIKAHIKAVDAQIKELKIALNTLKTFFKCMAILKSHLLKKVLIIFILLKIMNQFI